MNVIFSNDFKMGFFIFSGIFLGLFFSACPTFPRWERMHRYGQYFMFGGIFSFITWTWSEWLKISSIAFSRMIFSRVGVWKNMTPTIESFQPSWGIVTGTGSTVTGIGTAAGTLWPLSSKLKRSNLSIIESNESSSSSVSNSLDSEWLIGLAI